MQDKTLREKLGAAGRSRAAQYFNSRVYYSNLLKFYEEALRKKK